MVYGHGVREQWGEVGGLGNCASLTDDQTAALDGRGARGGGYACDSSRVPRARVLSAVVGAFLADADADAPVRAARRTGGSRAGTRRLAGRPRLLFNWRSVRTRMKYILIVQLFIYLFTRRALCPFEKFQYCISFGEGPRHAAFEGLPEF